MLREPLQSPLEPTDRDVIPGFDRAELLAVIENAAANGREADLLGFGVSACDSEELICALHHAGIFTASARHVNGKVTAIEAKAIRSNYRAMDLQKILERIEQRLAALDMSANAASKAAGKPDAIRNLRRAVKDGGRGGITTRTLAALADVLETTPARLIEGKDDAGIVPQSHKNRVNSKLPIDATARYDEDKPMRRSHIEQPQQLMPIYGAAEGGGGALILSKDPVEYREVPHYLANTVDPYGVHVVGDSMAPRYEHGEVAEVAPHYPYRGGDDVVLYRANHDGDERVMIKRLVSWTDDEWLLEQFNPPKQFKLSRTEWPTIHVVRGRGPRS